MARTEYPNTERFYKQFYPRLSAEGKRKADLLMNEYGIGHRDLTQEEIIQARAAMVAILKSHLQGSTPIRTQKCGETWVWMPCEKHRYTQLRDVVVVGRDFEDQPPFIQDDIMEHVLCGCQYRADDPEAAVRELRIEEKRHEWEMRAKMAMILAGGPPSGNREASLGWLVPVILGLMAGLMYWFLHR